jgi:hypothetical protein
MRVSIPFEARFLTAAIVPPDEAVAKSARIPWERGPRDESERNKSGFINLRLTQGFKTAPLTDYSKPKADLRQFRPEWGAQIVDMIDSGVAFSRKRGAT